MILRAIYNVIRCCLPHRWIRARRAGERVVSPALCTLQQPYTRQSFVSHLKHMSETEEGSARIVYIVFYTTTSIIGKGREKFLQRHSKSLWHCYPTLKDCKRTAFF